MRVTESVEALSALKASIAQTLKDKLPQLAILTAILSLLLLLNNVTDDSLLAARQEFDRRNLYQFFEEGSFDNDLVLDSYLLTADNESEKLENLHLLNLDRDRLAYIARKDGKAVAVAVPATADDGFNGKIELLSCRGYVWSH